MKKRKRKIPWIENKSRPILVWNETLFTTIVSTVRRWLGLENSKTKVDEGETKVKNGWLKRQPTEVMFYVSHATMFLPPYITRAPCMFDRASATNFWRDGLDRNRSLAKLEIYFYLSHFIKVTQLRERIRIEEIGDSIPNFPIISLEIFLGNVDSCWIPMIKRKKNFLSTNLYL